MLTLGLIREGKFPADNRVALSPAQCRWLVQKKHFKVLVQTSPNRCYADAEYEAAGLPVVENMSDCDLLLGIKEVPASQFLPGKTYLFFSHTKKLQPYNQQMLQTMATQGNTLIDYECLQHADGQRIIGFGFFAGVVGAHNGIMAYGQRTGTFSLGRVHQHRDYRSLIHTYFGLKLPPIKIAVTGSGRVAHGVLEIMHLMDVKEVEADEYLERDFDYPVYTHLKGRDLYARLSDGGYSRTEFHEQPQLYRCLFPQYLPHTDVLMNGVYWDADVPRLFENEALQNPDWRTHTIADITDDYHGSVPCNLGDATIAEPVYGVDRLTLQKTAPYLPGSVDLMAVGNLPNELARDASKFFGEQLIKYVLEHLKAGGSDMLSRATILRKGQLAEDYAYMQGYLAGDSTEKD